MDIDQKIEYVTQLIERVEFTLFGKTFYVDCHLDKKYGKRLYLQVSYHDKCRNTGEKKPWFGRKWYLSDHMTDDEVIKTSFAACKAVVDHEVMEGFTVDGIVLFNPHVSFESLLSVSGNEVRRAENG